MARYLIDANLPRYFQPWSSGDCEFVIDLGPAWSDAQIWTYARASRLTIVTKDADFMDRLLVEGDGPRVIHIRTGNFKLAEFHMFITPLWPEIRALSARCRLVQVYRDRIETIE